MIISCFEIHGIAALYINSEFHAVLYRNLILTFQNYLSPLIFRTLVTKSLNTPPDFYQPKQYNRRTSVFTNELTASYNVFLYTHEKQELFCSKWLNQDRTLIHCFSCCTGYGSAYKAITTRSITHSRIPSFSQTTSTEKMIYFLYPVRNLRLFNQTHLVIN